MFGLGTFVRKLLGAFEARSVVRARAAMRWVVATRKAGDRVLYGLGFGGKDPEAEHPFEWDPDTKAWRCDCSGFVLWCHDLERKDPASGAWRYTDSFERDAKGMIRGDIGDGVTWERAQPGDIISYGAGPKTGHCAIVLTVDAQGRPLLVMHCRGSLPGPLVETDAELWRKRPDTVVLRVRPPAALAA